VVIERADGIDRERAWQEMVPQIAMDVEGLGGRAIPLSPRGAVALAYPRGFALSAFRPGAARRAAVGAQ
jgi:hypothetical protein